MIAGVVCGVLVGGAGGRLAMLVLRLTSSDSLHGLQTDDGFTVGVVTTATLLLLAITAGLGLLGGLFYLVVRDWLPRRARPLLFGMIGATAGGALVINPGGVDFTVLEPHWLAVTLFVLLPAAYGVLVSVLAEWLLRPGRWQRRRLRWVVATPFLLLPLTGPPGILVLLVIAILIGVNRSGRVVRLWQTTPTRWLGRGAIVMVLSVSGVLLVRDIGAVL